MYYNNVTCTGTVHLLFADLIFLNPLYNSLVNLRVRSDIVWPYFDFVVVHKNRPRNPCFKRKASGAGFIMLFVRVLQGDIRYPDENT